jgi:hypothetical protein
MTEPEHEYRLPSVARRQPKYLFHRCSANPDAARGILEHIGHCPPQVKLAELPLIICRHYYQLRAIVASHIYDGSACAPRLQ